MLLSKFLADTISFSAGSVRLPLKSQVDAYREQYNALIKRANFTSTIYRIQPGNQIMVHVKVPSKTVSKFYYDVLLELEPTDRSAAIEDCQVKFFSNSPSFVYGGYAYIFYHMDTEGNNRKDSKSKGMMIDMFRRKVPRENLLVSHTAKKLGKDAVAQEPEIRNPMGIAIPDSSIYLAIFHILDTYKYNDLVTSRNRITEVQLLNRVMDFDRLMNQRSKTAATEKRKAKERQKAEDLEVAARKTSVVRAAKELGVKRPLAARSASTARSMKKPKRIGGRG